MIEGDAKGSQVISGDNQGIVISGATAVGNLVEGNLIGSDKTGLYAIPNAQEGVAISGATRQHDRRNDGRSPERDLRQQLGCTAGRRRSGSP